MQVAIEIQDAPASQHHCSCNWSRGEIRRSAKSLSIRNPRAMEYIPSSGFVEIIHFIDDCKYNIMYLKTKRRWKQMFYFHTDVNTAIRLLIQFTKKPHAWRERHYIPAIARILEVCYETNYKDCEGFLAMLRSFRPSVIRIFSDVYIEELKMNDKAGFLSYILEMLAKCKFDLGEKCAVECKEGETSIDLDSLMNSRIFWNLLGHGSMEEIRVLLHYGYPIMIEIYLRMENRETSPIVNGTMVVYCVLILRNQSDAREVLIACLEAVPFPIPTIQDLCLVGVPKRYQERYKKLLPEVLSLSHQPRTLKHLSRCTIRNQLKSCFRTPDAINKLVLKSELKNYLGLKQTEYDFKRLF